MNDTNVGRKTIRDKYELDVMKVMIGLLISFLLGTVVGGTIMYFMMPTKIEKVIVEIPVQQEAAIDNRVFTSEMSRDWATGKELGFKPLNVPLDEELQEYIYCLSYGYGIDFTLVMAIIEQESSFRTGVVSETNDYGLMQINEINHEWLSEQLGITDYLDPEQNVRAGLFILRKLYEKYNSDEKVLMAYNMGEGGAARLWKNGIYETQYTKGVLIKQEKFEKELKNEK